MNTPGKPTLDTLRELRSEEDFRDKAITLYGSTRNGWFHGAIDKVIAARGTRALDFLKYGVFDKRLEDGDRCYLAVSFLDSPRIHASIADIQHIFEWAAAEPTAIAELLPGYEVPRDYSPEERKSFEKHTTDLVLSSIRDPSIYVFPSLDAPYADEGTGPEYFFSFLRALQVILRRAESRDLAVVHIQNLDK